MKYLPSPEAERAVLDAIPDARRQEMVEIAIHPGLAGPSSVGSTGETWTSCPTLTIPRSKHGEARHVPMNSRARTILHGPGDATAAGRGRLDYVFRRADGHQPPPKADRWFPHAVAKACHTLAEAGRQADVERLKGFTWHCLRHTFASRLAMAGVDFLVIKELGGWKTLAMVTRYAHLSPGRLKERIERLAGEASTSPRGPRTSVTS